LPEFSDQFILQLGPGALADCCQFFDIDASLEEDDIVLAVFTLRDALRVVFSKDQEGGRASDSRVSGGTCLSLPCPVPTWPNSPRVVNSGARPTISLVSTPTDSLPWTQGHGKYALGRGGALDLDSSMGGRTLSSVLVISQYHSPL
jgi:hypothetical protein